MARHIPRVFWDQPLQTGTQLMIEGSVAHHLLRVLRTQIGMPLIVFDGLGGEYAAQVIATERQAITVRVDEKHSINRESSLQITLLQGVARGERMDYSIGKAVELGVTHIQPLMLARSQGLDTKRLVRKQQHWQAIAQSAAEQSGRTVVPSVASVDRLDHWLRLGKSYDLKLVLHPGSEQPLSNADRPGSIALLVGPEGGLSEAEVAMASESGFLPLSLGPRILRTETAGMAALAVLQAYWGDFLNG